LAKRVVLIGHPVTHSLSGVLQQAAFDAVGIDATYEPVDKLLIDLPETVNALRGDEYLGANITVPYKDRVVPMVDRLTEDASATGAVDTITREGSKLIGHNTDVPGFRVALEELAGRQKMPRAALVLGAGGGARAAVHVLITSGFQHVVVFNRHLHRAESLVKHFGRSAAHMELRARPWHESVLEAELAKVKVLINASSVGRNPEETPIPAEILPPELMVLDLLYVPKQSRLIRDAIAAGATSTLNGDVMLLNQSAAAFELWTGQQPPMDLLRERLEEVRSQEGQGVLPPSGADASPPETQSVPAGNTAAE
jgi:shikimate dehydrogenase